MRLANVWLRSRLHRHRGPWPRAVRHRCSRRWGRRLSIQGAIQGRSSALKSSQNFPVGDTAVVFKLLPAARVEIVFDNIFAEHGAQSCRVFKVGQCVTKVFCQQRNAFADIGIAVEFGRSEEHTHELQSIMRTSYAVFSLKKKN